MLKIKCNPVALLLLILPLLTVSCSNKEINHKTLLVYGTDAKITSYDLEKDKVNWTYKNAADTESRLNKFTVDDSVLYVPFQLGSVTALNVNTGKLIWNHKIKPIFDMFEPATDKDPNILLMGQTAITNKDLVFIASTNKLFYGLSKKDGKEVWTSTLKYTESFEPPVIIGDHVYLANTTELIKFDTETGMQMWSVNSENNVPLYSTLLTDGKRVFMADEKQKLYAVDDPYHVAWKFTMPEDQYDIDQNMALEDGVIYFCPYGGDKGTPVYAVNAKDGKKIWEKKQDKLYIKTLKVFDGQIFCLSDEKFLIMDSKDGKVLFETALTEKPISNIIEKDNNTLIYLSANGLVSFDKMKKKFDINKKVKFPVSASSQSFTYIKAI